MFRGHGINTVIRVCKRLQFSSADPESMISGSGRGGMWVDIHAANCPALRLHCRRKVTAAAANIPNGAGRPVMQISILGPNAFGLQSEESRRLPVEQYKHSGRNAARVKHIMPGMRVVVFVGKRHVTRD